MRTSEAQTVSVPFGKGIMDDRKRSLVVDNDDLAPPSKRQASAVNGALPRMEPEKEKEIEVHITHEAATGGYRPDVVQLYQKDAIFRQMRDYKREKGLYEAQVVELTKRSKDHDDHLRTIDAWFSQVSIVHLSMLSVGTSLTDIAVAPGRNQNLGRRLCVQCRRIIWYEPPHPHPTHWKS